MSFRTARRITAASVCLCARASVYVKFFHSTRDRNTFIRLSAIGANFRRVFSVDVTCANMIVPEGRTGIVYYVDLDKRNNCFLVPFYGRAGRVQITRTGYDYTLATVMSPSKQNS